MSILASDLRTVSHEAYTYLYPLVTMEVTRRQLANIPPGTREGFGPPNQFHHLRTFPDADFRAVVRPNFDTLYSLAWLDLTRGPVIVEVPDSDDRYYMMPMLDMWTDVFANPGKRTTGTGAQTFVVTAPGYTGDLPAGATPIAAPTPHVWVIGRTQTNGPADYAAVNAFQDGLRITELAGPSTFVIDESVDTTTEPLRLVDDLSAVDFFALAGQVLATLQSPELSQAVLRYQNAALRAELANQEVARREQLARLGESNRPLEEAQEDEATARADLDSARAQLRLAKSQRDRVRGLKQDGITSGQQLEEAEATLATSQARVREAEQHLVIARRRTGRESKLGSDQTRLRQAVAEAVTEQATARAELEAAADQLSVLGATPGQGARLGLPALHDGLVLERPAVLGQAVQAGSDLFTLQDTGRLLARVDLSEEQLPDVRPGLRVHVRAKAFPQRTFSGRISFVSSQLDPKTRTARAFATVDNQAGNLKADMFVTVELELGATRQAVLIPETALVRTDEGQAVYVAIDPKTFQRQAVEIGGLEGGWREIKEGLKAGQKVVSRGSFSLQSEEQKDSLGEEEGE